MTTGPTVAESAQAPVEMRQAATETKNDVSDLGVCRTCDASMVARRSRQKPRRNCLGNFAINNRQAKPAATELMSEKRPQASFSNGLANWIRLEDRSDPPENRFDTFNSSLHILLAQAAEQRPVHAHERLQASASLGKLTQGNTPPNVP
jgi:hypothetical protein